ncbi:DUF2285 domain-containing protein [Rhizorhabdus histidinilytica]|uniref:DUF2285 domain-containing protein n=1 Tax=Rhizorhabdus histidinilytica TaxID=439228 RepID=UPI001ADA3359|nr:DUF2285 domain-containing protein [Rhizorhabdus histidinilytica]
MGTPVADDDVLPHAVAGVDDQHGRLTVQDGHVNLTYLPPTDGGRFVAVVILDEDTPDRLYAISRLWAAIRSRPVPADNRITEQRRKRIPQMLRVVDGRLAGVKYRSIAEALFPSHKIDSSSWAGDALREITIRLARDGLQLVEGGYRTLLRRPRRS